MLTYSKKIPIGISACVYGAKVRYNRKGWDMVKHIGRDIEMLTFHPMCPEVMSGMGVPRKAIRIKGESGQAVWDQGASIVASDGVNWSPALKDACRDVMALVEKQEIKAYVFMEGSPTCGVYRTTLKNKRLGKPPGVLGAQLLNSDLFLINGMDLQSPIKWWDIKRRLLAYVYLLEYDIHDKASLYEIWHQYKFICQELHEKEARTLGHEIANLPKVVDQKTLETYKKAMLAMLNRASTPAKIKQMLWKQYSFLRKKEGLDIPEVLSPTDLRGMHYLAKELNQMTLKAFERDLVYGQVPVLYRR